jgi:hypothetical protein
MKGLVTAVSLMILIVILSTEGRFIAFAVLGVIGAAILAALIDSTHSRN